jgi:hypothetical protein
MMRQCRQCPAVIQLDPGSICELDDRASEPVDWNSCARNQPVTVHAKVSMKRTPIREMHQLMLASSLDSNDLQLTQSSRCGVGKLSKNGGMKRLCSRDRLTFDSAFQALHRFFNFGQLGHVPSYDSTKRHLRNKQDHLASSRAHEHYSVQA